MMHSTKKVINHVVFFAITLSLQILAREGEEEMVEQVKIGNLSLPFSQQLAPLLGFGQTNVPQYDTLAYLYGDFFRGRCKKTNELIPILIYGIRNNIALELAAGFSPQYTLFNETSSGPEDFYAQLEYAYYQKAAETWLEQATVFAGIFVPSGDFDALPPLGLGSCSFFLGFTVAHEGVDWYYYASGGALLTTKHSCGTKVGNEFRYQVGIGKNIAYSSNNWIFSCMLELDGVYDQKSKVDGVLVQDSGGNRVVICPSLFFSTQHSSWQLGVTPLLFEHFFGEQPKDHTFISFAVGFKFN